MQAIPNLIHSSIAHHDQSSSTSRQSPNRSARRQLLNSLKIQINAQFPGDDIEMKELREMLIHQRLKNHELQRQQQSYQIESHMLRLEIGKLNDKIQESQYEIFKFVVEFGEKQQESAIKEYEEIMREMASQAQAIEQNNTQLIVIPENEVYGLLDNQINDIPTITNSNPQVRCEKCKQTILEGNKCYLLSCQHMFHQQCLRNELKKKACCPYCLKNLTLFDLLGNQ